MKVKFVKDAIIKVNGVAEVLFKEGAVEELNDASAERWRRRGVAIDYVEDSVRVVEATETASSPAEPSAEEPKAGKSKKPSKD